MDKLTFEKKMKKCDKLQKELDVIGQEIAKKMNKWNKKWAKFVEEK